MPNYEDFKPRRLLEEVHGRDLIHNTWDVEASIVGAKNDLKNQPNVETIGRIANLGRRLLENEDPYTLKVGIQLLRLAMWHDPEIANEWMKVHAPVLFEHSHPRVRHSTLWNIRSAVWQNGDLAASSLPYAKKGLSDPDYAIQQVAMWVHGDATINNSAMYDEAMISMRDMLLSSPKEPNVLFALEEFFVPISTTFGRNLDYLQTVEILHDFAKDMPGLQLRTSFLLDEKYKPSDTGLAQIQQRVMGKHKDTEIATFASQKQYSKALQAALGVFNTSREFNDKRSLLWTMRDLLLLEPGLAYRLYESLIPLVMDKRDGDLVRIAIVLLGNSLLLNPLGLAKTAIETTSDFVDKYDIDGSQIIMLQTLLPLTKNPESLQLVSAKKPYFTKMSANKSVQYAIDTMF